jgi:hypothetical protein
MISAGRFHPVPVPERQDLASRRPSRHGTPFEFQSDRSHLPLMEGAVKSGLQHPLSFSIFAAGTAVNDAWTKYYRDGFSSQRAGLTKVRWLE